MPAPAPLAALFDMDGVLVRSEEAWWRTVEEAARRFGERPVAREEFDATFGQGVEADIAAFGWRCTAHELDRFYTETFPRFTRDIVVEPVAPEVLRRLLAAELRIAVVTNTPTPLAETILARCGLRDYVHVVAGADQVPRAKPAPDLLVHALGRLEAMPDQAWMVGDSRYDRDAARAAGVYFIGLRLDGDARLERLADLPPKVLPRLNAR